GVNDLKVFDVVIEVGAESQLHAEELFHPDEKVSIFGTQTLEDTRMNQDTKLVFLAVVTELQAADDRAELALQFDRHRRRALHDASAAAVRAIGVQIARERFLLAL